MTEKQLTEAEEWQLEWRLAMMHSALTWPGTSISDGAFDVLRQVREFQEKQKNDLPALSQRE